jgi:hypothetical protein
MEEFADETRRVEAATSPPLVASPPRTRVRREAVQGEEEEAGQSAAEKATPMEKMRTPPASPPNPPQENPGREQFPVGQDPVLPGVSRAEQQEAGRDESAGLSEELLAAARHATESAEVR